jgi:hypothetical protein
MVTEHIGGSTMNLVEKERERITEREMVDGPLKEREIEEREREEKK